MNRQCLALDLKDDPVLIAKYEEYHSKVWPEILDSLRDQELPTWKSIAFQTDSS